jgi:hypothetical protein
MNGPSSDLFGEQPPVWYPDAPGHKGEAETGREAAEAVALKCGRLQRMTLAAIRAAGASGLTADEAAAVLRLDRWSVQPRTSELRAKGLIVDSGLRRLNSSGRRAVAWVTPEHKREAA